MLLILKTLWNIIAAFLIYNPSISHTISLDVGDIMEINLSMNCSVDLVLEELTHCNTSVNYQGNHLEVEYTITTPGKTEVVSALVPG